MKVLVVGSVPPPICGHRKALLAEVLRLANQGHDVEIVSLDPLSVAHRYVARSGVPAALEVASLARKADLVVLQIEPGLPVRHGAGRGERLVALLLLAAGLRLARDVTLRLQHADDLNGGPGGRAAIQLWKAADHIEVGDEALRTDLAAVLGPLCSRVSVMPAPSASGENRNVGLHAVAPDGWAGGATTTASQVQAVTRARAAAERQTLAANGRLSVRGGGSVRIPQWQWLPTPGAGVPDLWQVHGEAARPVPASARPEAKARRSSPSRSTRLAVTALLAAADRRRLTAPVARLARVGLSRFRRVLGR